MNHFIKLALRSSMSNVRKSRLPFVFNSRNITQTPSGAYLARPQRVTLGVTKLMVVIVPSVYIGGMVSMIGANLLEDYDIFVPEDEDD